MDRAGYSYSGIVLIKPGQKAGVITVSPNPFRDKIQFTVTSDKEGSLRYTLVGLDGKHVKGGVTKLSKGSNTFFVNDAGTLQPGIYMLCIRTDDEMQTIEMIKK